MFINISINISHSIIVTHKVAQKSRFAQFRLEEKHQLGQWPGCEKHFTDTFGEFVDRTSDKNEEKRGRRNPFNRKK